MFDKYFDVPPKSKLHWFFITGLIALVIRLWFCFADGHQPMVYSCDASEYLRDAQYLEKVSHYSADFWLDALKVLSGLASPEVVSKTQEKMAILMPLVKQSGFIFPFFIFLSHVVFGASIDYASWWAPVFFQCLYSAATCVLIGLCASFAFNWRAGLWAASLAAIYPGFIINTGRLYSEVFACFFLCVGLYHLARISRGGGWLAFGLLGFSLAVMQTARSPLVMLSILSLALVLYLKRSKLKTPRVWGGLSVFVFGAFLVLSVSLSVQKLTTGKASLVTDRVGSYNLFTGLNLNDKGWLAYPYPDLTGVEKMKFKDIILDRMKQPKQFFQLMMDKPPRLLKFHWNDFRTNIGFLGQHAQVIVHQAMMLLALLGICLGLFNKQASTKENAQAFKVFLIVCILSHVIFALFITVPRYALSAIPELLIFAGFACQFLWQNLQETVSRKSALLLLFMLLLMLGVSQCWWGAGIMTVLSLSFFALLLSWQKKQTSFNTAAGVFTVLSGIVFTFCWAWPSYAHGRPSEYVGNDALPISWSVKMDERFSENNRYYILLDCAKWSEIARVAKIKIGDDEIKGDLIPLMPFLQDFNDYKKNADNSVYLEFEYIFTALCRASNISLLDLRQWYVLPIPSELLKKKLRSTNFDLAIEPESPGEFTIYNTTVKPKKDLVIPGLFRASWEKAFYGVDNPGGFSDARYEDKAAPASFCRESSPGVSFVCNANLHLLELSGKNNSELQGKVSRNKSVGANVTLNNPPQYGKNSNWIITCRGLVSYDGVEDKDIPVDISASVYSKDESVIYHYESPWVPSKLSLKNGSNNYSFSFPLKPSGMPGKIDRIEFRAEVQNANTKIDFAEIEVNDSIPFPDKTGYRVF